MNASGRSTVSSFDEIFKSESRVLSSKTYDKGRLLGAISGICFSWLKINSPDNGDGINEAIALQFAETVLETRFDWKPEDITYFFKTVVKRQDLPEFRIFGNKVTALKLGEMLVGYENLRAEARETSIKQFKEISEPRHNIDPKPYTTEILERLKYKPEPKQEMINENNRFIQDCIIEFDKLYDEQQKGNLNHIKLVDYVGRKFDLTDYLRYRMEEKFQKLSK